MCAFEYPGVPPCERILRSTVEPDGDTTLDSIHPGRPPRSEPRPVRAVRTPHISCADCRVRPACRVACYNRTPDPLPSHEYSMASLRGLARARGKRGGQRRGSAGTIDVLTPATSETWDPVEVPPLPPPRPTPGKGMAPGLNIMMRIALLARLALCGCWRDSGCLYACLAASAIWPPLSVAAGCLSLDRPARPCHVAVASFRRV